MTHRPAAARTRSTVVLAAAALLLPAASASAATADPAQPAAEAQPAWVRATHLVPDLPQMDIDVVSLTGGGTTTVDGAGYGDVSSYVKVPAGGFTVGVRAQGSAPDAAPVLSTTLQADPGAAYTIAALGTAADARIVPLLDDLTPPAAGKARVRVLAAASTAGSVDVTAVTPTASTVVTRGAAFGSATTYADVPAGRWTLQAAPAAGTPATASAGSSEVDLAAGSTYTLAVLDGSAAGTGEQLAVEAFADAVGASAVPAGGAATGFGGSAALSSQPARTSSAAVRDGALGATAAAALGALVLVSRRRAAATPQRATR